MTQLRLYDTLRRSIHPFAPRSPGVARVYSCGPTVYSRQHLGNLRPYVLADLLKRVLHLQGYEVRHVINITDVGHLTDDADHGEDKVELAARRDGSSALEIAARWTELFQRDLELLGVLPPSVWAKASQHIPQQIAMVGALEAKGFTYRTADGIYFDTTRDPGYGALSRLRASTEHTRLESAAEKRRAADFALWKFSPAGGPRRQLEWPSPWGVGFPGWHIECSAMASHHLGPEIDIHTGGVDHIAVHHTNEIAQSENALGSKPWVRFWMHGAWLVMNGEKLSKSKGTVRHTPSLDDLERWGVTPAGFRYYLYTAHYRSPLDLSVDALRAAEAARKRLSALARAGGSVASGEPAPLPSELRSLRRRFFDALKDDLDAPRALSALWEVMGNSASVFERAALVRELCGVLGLSLREHDRTEPDDGEVTALVAQRDAARQGRDYALADLLRAQLSARGVLVEDSPEGSKWRRL